MLRNYRPIPGEQFLIDPIILPANHYPSRARDEVLLILDCQGRPIRTRAPDCYRRLVLGEWSEATP